MFDSNRTIKLVTKNRLILWLNGIWYRTISYGSVCPLFYAGIKWNDRTWENICICDIDNERIDCNVGKKALKFIKCILIIIIIIVKRSSYVFLQTATNGMTHSNQSNTKQFGNFGKRDETRDRRSKQKNISTFITVIPYCTDTSRNW